MKWATPLPATRKRVVLAAVLAAVLSLLPAGILLGQVGTAPQTAAAVIPDSGGAIAELVLHYVPDTAFELEPVYRDLFACLPADVRLQVLCPSEEAVSEFRQHWAAQAESGGRGVRLINVGRPISVWARDRRIARQDTFSLDAATTVVPSEASDYRDDQRNELDLPSVLASVSLVPGVLTSDLHIEGGNIVSNERHAFVGANVYDDNLVAASDLRAFDAELRRLLGRDYVILEDATGCVPWCHADMYLTPVDNHTVLVASPALAETLLRIASEASLVPLDVPDHVLAYGLNPKGEVSCDSIAGLMTEYGYRVVRLPAVIGPNEEWMVTYNNCLMEDRGGCRVVYMPIYHVSPLDEAAAFMYEALGFDVHRIDVSAIYENGGALRCLANVTQRRPASHVTQTQHTQRSVARTPITAADATSKGKRDVPKVPT